MSNKITNNQHNGHEFVEIGGIKWATCNVGAEKPTDAGLYFQWGDRKGYTADEISDATYFDFRVYKHDNGKHFTKYNQFDKKQVLDLCDDAAFAYMGQGWRMPTKDDFRCLFESTTHRWTNSYHRSGVEGMVFTDITDNTKELFFPAAGYCHSSHCGVVYGVGNIGHYWSRSLYSGCIPYAHYLSFDNYMVYQYRGCVGLRYYGCSVRGVAS